MALYLEENRPEICFWEWAFAACDKYCEVVKIGFCEIRGKIQTWMDGWGSMPS